MADSILHLARPAVPVPGIPTISAPRNVIIQAQALFQILDHALRKQRNRERVIGTLLGVRSDDGLELEIRNAYTIPHEESDDLVTVSVDYNRTMYALHKRAHPKDVILGWYATSSDLNNLSALVQDFYGQPGGGTFPYPAVHLTVEATSANRDVDVRTYISSPVGVSAERIAGNCIFVPVPNEIRYSEVEQGALSVISKAMDKESRAVDVVSDIKALEETLLEVREMIARVSDYVSGVIDGSKPANVAVGKYLLKCLSLVPSITKENMEALFNSHMQDVLMVMYLANTVKTQLQLSSRLTPLIN